MYIPFDTFPENDLRKQRELCFDMGCNGERLAQTITDARDKHSKNVAALSTTIHLFAENEPKRRLHGLVTSRREQEQKWVKHYDVCINEHKKGLIVAKLKQELIQTRDVANKREAHLKAQAEARLQEQRVQLRIEHRKEFEAEQKAKNKDKPQPKKPKSWYHWLFNWAWLNDWLNYDSIEEEPKPTPAPNVAKTLVIGKETSAKEKRELYMLHKASSK